MSSKNDVRASSASMPVRLLHGFAPVNDKPGRQSYLVGIEVDVDDEVLSCCKVKGCVRKGRRVRVRAGQVERATA